LHKIRTQSIEMNVSPKHDTFMLHRRCSDLLSGPLEKVMEEVCNDLIPRGIHLRLDTLTLDMGDVQLPVLERELPVRVREKLTSILSDLIQKENREGHSPIAEISPDKLEEELLIVYLRTGATPWWCATEPDFSLEKLINRMATQTPDQLCQVLKTELQNPIYRKRLILQCSKQVIRGIAKVLNDNIENIEFEFWLSEKIGNSIGYSHEHVLSEYLKYLVPKEKLDRTWGEYLINLAVEENPSSLESIPGIIDEAPTNYRTNLEKVWYKYLSETGKVAEKRKVRDEEIEAMQVSELWLMPSKEVEANIRSLNREKLISFLTYNLVHGIGTIDWIERIDDKKLEEIVLALKSQNVDSREVTFLIPLLERVRIPGIAFHSLRKSIWKAALLNAIPNRDTSNFFLSALELISIESGKSLDEIVVLVSLTLNETPEKNDYAESYLRQLTGENKVEAKSDNKELTVFPPDVEVDALIADFQQAVKHSNLEVVEQLIRKILLLRSSINKKHRENLQNTLCGNTFENIIQHLDHSRLMSLADFLDSENAGKLIPVIPDFLTVCSVYEENFAKDQVSGAFVIQVKAWLWQSIWLAKESINEVRWVREHLEKIASFSRVSHDKVAIRFSKITSILTSEGFTFSSAFNSAMSELEKSKQFEELNHKNELDISINLNNQELEWDQKLTMTLAGDFMEEHFKNDPEQEYFIQNSGLILLASFLPAFFRNVGLLNESKAFTDENSRIRAIHLSQFLLTGASQPPEHLLTLNKVICGLPLYEPIPTRLSISEEEKKEAAELLTSVIANWSVLKNTSIDGFRTSFLQRPGKLSRIEDGWKLQVEERPYDMLLDQLPWGINICTLPWNDYLIYTEWNHS